MAEKSNIQWTDASYNPWRGCTKVAPGCKFCYAESNMSVKLHGVKWGPRGTRVRSSDSYWNQPKKWDKVAKMEGVRKKVFCASLADVFEEWNGPITTHKNEVLWKDKKGVYADAEKSGFQPYEIATMDHLRADLFKVIDETPNLDWLLLTKRPQNIRKMWAPMAPIIMKRDLEHRPFFHTGMEDMRYITPYRRNVWLGCSVSEQETFEDSYEALLDCAELGSVLFLSYEPSLGPIDLRAFLEAPTPSKKWVIVGGESSQGGNKGRRFDLSWARSVISQCKKAKVPCFVKQLGADVTDGPLDINEPNGKLRAISLSDSHGGNMEQWPEDIRVREFP